MLALICERHGLPDTLRVGELPTPTPAAGELLVEVHAAGVNFPDALIIQNKYQSKPPLPFVPGGELAGKVVAVGEGVTGWSAGDAVMALTGTGAFSTHAVVRAERAVRLPAGVPLDVAAAFMLTYGTSWHALKDRAALKAGETVLVLGAAGGVGIAAIQIAKALGARVIAAASTAEKLALCEAQGADATINYTNEDLRERLKALTGGKGPDVIFDPVGGDFAEPAFRSIAWRGRYLVIGFANGEIPRLPLNLPLLKGADVLGVFWGSYTEREPEAFQQDLVTLNAMVADGRLKPLISARYPLRDAARALDDMLQRKVTGKVVILTQNA